jgi:hypothetical protein
MLSSALSGMEKNLLRGRSEEWKSHAIQKPRIWEAAHRFGAWRFLKSGIC